MTFNMRWLASEHLPTAAAREIVEVYRTLAEHLVAECDEGPELDQALQGLVVSKDAAVRASLLTTEKAEHPLVPVPCRHPRAASGGVVGLEVCVDCGASRNRTGEEILAGVEPDWTER